MVKMKVILDIIYTDFPPLSLRAVMSKQKLHWTKLREGSQHAIQMQ